MESLRGHRRLRGKDVHISGIFNANGEFLAFLTTLQFLN